MEGSYFRKNVFYGGYFLKARKQKFPPRDGDKVFNFGKIVICPFSQPESCSRCFTLAPTHSSYSFSAGEEDKMNGYRKFVPVNVVTDKRSPSSFLLPCPLLSSVSWQKNGKSKFPVFFVFYFSFVAPDCVSPNGKAPRI